PTSMPRYTCMESQHRISPPRLPARSSPSALLPEAVGPRMATARGGALVSAAAKATLELRQRQPHQHRAPVRAVRAQVHLVELGEERQRLLPGHHVARAPDAVAGQRGEEVIERLLGQRAARAAVAGDAV